MLTHSARPVTASADLLPMNHTQNGDKIVTVLKAWTSNRPQKTFSGMTLAEFNEAVKDSIELRKKISAARVVLEALLVERAAADARSMQVVQRVVNAVIADPTEGADCELYELMGYVRKSKRASGLTRGKRRAAGKSKRAK